jgi:hypothetical protein
MFVLCTDTGKILDTQFYPGNVLEIPPEYYDPARMSRIGSDLPPYPQRAVLVRWKRLAPSWPHPING